MPGIYLPDYAIAREIDAAHEQQVDTQLAAAREWTEELRRIDPNLEIVWVGEGATEADLAPARWHIRRKNPETVDTYYPLVGDNGEYREPGEWMLHELKARDLWNPRVHRDWREAREKLRESKRRAKARQIEQRQDEMALSARAAKRLRGESQFTTTTARKRAGEGIKTPPEDIAA